MQIRVLSLASIPDCIIVSELPRERGQLLHLMSGMGVVALDPLVEGS